MLLLCDKGYWITVLILVNVLLINMRFSFQTGQPTTAVQSSWLPWQQQQQQQV